MDTRLSAMPRDGSLKYMLMPSSLTQPATVSKHISCSNPISRDIPPPQRFISGPHALKTIEEPFNFYWRPQEPNFPGLDALIRVDNTVWGLQYTMGKTRREATDGLD